MELPIYIWLDIEPSRTTHQSALRVMRRKGGGFFVGKYAKSAAKQWAETFSALIRPHRPKTPLDTPLMVLIDFRFPHTKGCRKKDLEKSLWKVTRPDLDNMEKGILDALTREGFMLDDSQIAWKETKKSHVPTGKVGIKIEITSLDNERHVL